MKTIDEHIDELAQEARDLEKKTDTDVRPQEVHEGRTHMAVHG